MSLRFVPLLPLTAAGARVSDSSGSERVDTFYGTFDITVTSP